MEPPLVFVSHIEHLACQDGVVHLQLSTEAQASPDIGRRIPQSALVMPLTTALRLHRMLGHLAGCQSVEAASR